MQLALLKSDPRSVARLMLQSFLRQARAPGARRAAVVDVMCAHACVYACVRARNAFEGARGGFDYETD